MVWYAQAYNLGWLHSLILPQVGYLNVVPRLGTGLALLVPLQWAPLVMAIVGLLIQALPVPILLSARCSNWASLPTRHLVGRHLRCPTQRQGNPRGFDQRPVAHGSGCSLAGLCRQPANLAWSPLRWSSDSDRRPHRALLHHSCAYGFALLVAAPPELDSGDFRPHQPIACLQIWLLLHSTQRAQGALGANVGAFLRMLGGNIVSCAVFGSYSFAWLAPMVYHRGGCPRRPLHISLLLSLRQSRMEIFPGLLCGLACGFAAQPSDGWDQSLPGICW